MTQDTTDEWSIHEVARLADTTSRTLRHYQAEGLLEPSRIGTNGYRYYDGRALVRLQRILLLRALGLGIEAIRGALESEPDAVTALRIHLEWLRAEQERLARQVAAVQHTIEGQEGGGRVVAEKMFDGFDHTQYKDEVESRWGREAYASSDTWWRAMSAEDRAAWMATSTELAKDWTRMADSGAAPQDEAAQELAARHAAWLGSIPGTPGSESGRPTKAYLDGLGEMYVADDRFAANYGGTTGAEFVRDALRVWSEHLS